MLLSKVKHYFSIRPELLLIKTPSGMVSLKKLCLPLMLEQLCFYLLGTVNTAVLSAYSETAVAMVGVGTQLINMYANVVWIITFGTTSVLSHCLGAQKPEEADMASYVAVCLCGMVSIGFGVLAALCWRPVLTLMNLDAATMAGAAPYYCVRSVCLVVYAMGVMFNNLLMCRGVAYPSIVSGVISNVVNLGGSVLAIRVFSHDLRLVMLAVAFSCVLGQGAGMAYSCGCYARKKFRLQRPGRWDQTSAIIAKILRIGIPGGISTMCFALSQTVTTSILALLGTAMLSAKVYFSTITPYCYLISYCVGTATSIVVGWLCGAHRFDDADELCRRICRWTTILNLLVSAALLLLRVPILSLFTKQPEILGVALGIFAVDLVIEQARAYSHVYEYSLRTAGDTFFSMICITISCWVNGVLMAYVLAIPMGLGLLGVWLGFALDEITRALVVYFRWRTKKWIRKSSTI